VKEYGRSWKKVGRRESHHNGAKKGRGSDKGNILLYYIHYVHYLVKVATAITSTGGGGGGHFIFSLSLSD